MENNKTNQNQEDQQTTLEPVNYLVEEKFKVKSEYLSDLLAKVRSKLSYFLQFRDAQSIPRESPVSNYDGYCLIELQVLFRNIAEQFQDIQISYSLANELKDNISSYINYIRRGSDYEMYIDYRLFDYIDDRLARLITQMPLDLAVLKQFDYKNEASKGNVGSFIPINKVNNVKRDTVKLKK